MQHAVKQINRVGWGPGEWGERYGFSRSFVYKLINEGKLTACKINARTVITVEADEAFRKTLNSTPQG